MLLRQIIHDDLGCASYLIGDERAGVAAVVDPRFAIEGYLGLARSLGVRITDVLETHNHADHLSGHGRLIAATGATVRIHREARPDYPHEPFDDGFQLALGDLVVRALHTPGHRPEHTSFLLCDGRRAGAVRAVLSGDCLFAGDVARPDLAVERTAGARGIHASLARLLALGDEVQVWPGHLGGSMCGGPGMELTVSSTIGWERAHNPMLALPDADAFVERSLARLGAPPPNFQAIVALNRGMPITEAAPARPLTPGELAHAAAAGRLLVDVRGEAEFAEAHVPGAVCIPLDRAGFATRLAWVSRGLRPVVFVGDDDAGGIRAAGLAAAVGFLDEVGYLSGGMASWRAEGRELARMTRIRADAFPAWRRGPEGEGAQVIDVRERTDWEAAHLVGSIQADWHALAEAPDGVDLDATVAVICASGARAATGASLLARLGATRVVHVAEGGVPTLAELGVPLRAVVIPA